jgi:hypothetical protein
MQVAQKLSQQGYDPFGQKGVWLEFNRSGTGFETVVDVQPLRTVEMVNGRRVEVVAESELTYDLAAQALDVCPDLNELMESYRLSEEQVRTIAEGSGDPEEVDAVWGWSQKSAEAPSAPAVRQEAPAPVQPKPAPVQAPAPAPVAVKAAPVVAPPAVEELDEEALLLQKLQEARAKKLAAAAKPAAPVVAEASQLDLPDDDFESLFKRRG